MDVVPARQHLIEWLEAQLCGSFLKDGDQLNNASPLQRFPIALLFPVDPQGIGLDPADEGTIDDTENDDLDCSPTLPEVETLQTAESLKQRRYVPPSSVGFSFYVAGGAWQLHIVAKALCFNLNTDYQVDQKGTIRNSDGEFTAIEGAIYDVHAVGGDEEALNVSHACTVPVFKQVNISPYPQTQSTYCAEIDVRTFTHGEGVIITVTLINNQEIDQTEQGAKWQLQQLEKTLFNVSLDCYIEQGEVGNYPSVDYSLLSDADQEIELQYANKKVYAVGHGAAVTWELGQGRVQKISSRFMPVTEVPQVTADVLAETDANKPNVLSMAFLTNTDKNLVQTCQSLQQFVDDYAGWIEGQDRTLQQIEPEHFAAGQRIVNRMQTARQRMQAGIERLKNDPLAAQAFGLTNRTMLMQMRQTNLIEQTPDKACNWRAFQLAFILTALTSATCEPVSDMAQNSDQHTVRDLHRDVVDLIWFPTGGGKTEAYLGLTAYVIAYRRLKYPATGGGTTAFMRYTLRLLTTQQFTRACRMICALELLRRNEAASEQPTFDLGETPVSIGLWVGGSTSPNTLSEVQTLIEKAEKTGNVGAFVVTRCPWCNTAFNHKNLLFNGIGFYFTCTQSACEFGRISQNKLPCNVVDEMLYAEPPTLLVATLDKFARLTWEERAQAFFGVDNNRPPELVIQDELHLIAGALGSIAGVYEAGLETMLKGKGFKPKYVASTATIKEADDQIKKLFGKALAVFPPPGLCADDAYFAKTVALSMRPGRMYVGYFAPLLNRQKNLAPLAALLLIAPIWLTYNEWHDQGNKELLDAWWTQLVYHGSLKGVGNSHNAFNIAVQDIYDRLLKEFRQNRLEELRQHRLDQTESYAVIGKNQAPLNSDEIRFNELMNALEQRRYQHISQLTSNASAQENADTFAALILDQSQEKCVDVLLATNMVSVGLDVARLALMVINGQPLTTAEYIQASSRVGRSRVPGVVLVNYYRDQARSLSHYENFQPYHESFYRFVEPTSVTPFTYQARKRALHAGLVLALRHVVPRLRPNHGAHDFDPDASDIKTVYEQYIKRCQLADPARAQSIDHHVRQLVTQWYEHVLTRQKKNRRVSYYDTDANTDSLLCDAAKPDKGLWPTLNSMRNVEHTGILKIS